MSTFHDAIRATGNADAIAALDRHIERVATRRNSPDNDDASYEESRDYAGPGFCDRCGRETSCTDNGFQMMLCPSCTIESPYYGTHQVGCPCNVCHDARQMSTWQFPSTLA